MTVDIQHVRLIEALLFAAVEPLDDEALSSRLPEGTELIPVLAELVDHYGGRGIELTRVAGKWAFRTAPDLAGHLRAEKEVVRRLTRAMIETLSIIAYHQPITRAEIEEVRGVSLSKGTLDVLLEAGWVRPGRRRRTPGRPLTWITTDGFLEHFGLDGVEDLPGIDELRATGLLDARPAASIVDLTLGDGATETDGETEQDVDQADIFDQPPLDDESEPVRD
jgi:segregation and condensation protein B